MNPGTVTTHYEAFTGLAVSPIYLQGVLATCSRHWLVVAEHIWSFSDVTCHSGRGYFSLNKCEG